MPARSCPTCRSLGARSQVAVNDGPLAPCPDPWHDGQEPEPQPSPPRPVTGRLIRDHDVSGVSGEGHVADVVAWPDGTATVRWLGDWPTTQDHDRGIEGIEHIHGHGGATHVVWDNPMQTPPNLKAVEQRLGDALQSEVEGWDIRPQLETLWPVVRDVQPLLAEVARLRSELQVERASREFLDQENTDLSDHLDVVTSDAEVYAGTMATAHARIEELIGEVRVAHIEHAGVVAALRSAVSDAAACLDVAGLHSTAQQMRASASLPLKGIPSSVYANQGMPRPVEARQVDALAWIARSSLCVESSRRAREALDMAPIEVAKS
jgi:hypothetical protein